MFYLLEIPKQKYIYIIELTQKSIPKTNLIAMKSNMNQKFILIKILCVFVWKKSLNHYKSVSLAEKFVIFEFVCVFQIDIFIFAYIIYILQATVY